MRNIKIIILTIFSLTIASFGGCASNRINLVDNGTVTIERVNSKKMLISKVSVYQEGETLVIKGKVRRRFSSGIAAGGHVDIAVFDQEEKPIKNITKHYASRWVKHPHASSFTVRLPLILSQGSVVRVAHHSGAHHENQGI